MPPLRQEMGVIPPLICQMPRFVGQCTLHVLLKSYLFDFYCAKKNLFFIFLTDFLSINGFDVVFLPFFYARHTKFEE